MTTIQYERWLDSVLPTHARLTKSVVSIVESLLHENGIDYLTVVGRTKDKSSALEKIRRKQYSDPLLKLTDLSGIRIVLYFETDVQRVGELIRAAFEVDAENSLDKDSLLSTNQIGYRSVHYVCSLGPKRAEVEEYKSFSKLKFEFQVRTVLQHAWAELAHDRKYKFSQTLPPELERQLYLYAGLLEIADKGFDETAKAIEKYSQSLKDRTGHGDLDIGLDSLSLVAYFNHWAKENDLAVENTNWITEVSELVQELHEFGIKKISELAEIIPANYAKLANEIGYNSTIFGIVRDWMLIKDWRRFFRDVKFNWTMAGAEMIERLIPAEDIESFRETFDWMDDIDDEPPENVDDHPQ